MHKFHLALLVVSLTTTALVGCDKKPSAKSKPSPPPSSSQVAKKPAQHAPPPAADISIDEMTKALHCPSGEKSVCAVLEGFSKASRWKFVNIRSNEARYFGEMWTRRQGETKKQWGMLFIKRVPLNEVEPGDLPIRISVRTLDPSLGPQNRHAPKLMRLLKLGHAVNKNHNQTANYILDYTVGQWHTAGPSTGASIIVDLDNDTFIREGKRRELYLIEQANARPGIRPDDGLYAVFYPLTW